MFIIKKYEVDKQWQNFKGNASGWEKQREWVLSVAKQAKKKAMSAENKKKTLPQKTSAEKKVISFLFNK